ncbi:MAG: hypothetical protein Fur0032_00220 [Terrimicrobiaceae bacterium]
MGEACEGGPGWEIRGEVRRVLHLDADAFFASVEQAADPRLRGRPVAVGGARRGVVASASYEARRLGIYTTMPTARAKKLCPSLVVVAGDFEKYERFSRFLFSYAYDHTPTVEVTSIDEGYADLTGNRRKSPREVAEQIRRAVRETLRITLSEGIGTNKLVSAVASKLRKPDALVEVAPGTEREFLAPLEAKWLPGVGPKLAESLRRAGLGRIGQVAETPPGQLALFAGGAAGTLWEMARGVDTRPVVAEPPAAQSLGEQETFEKDTTDEHFVRARLRCMADRLLGRLRAEKRMSRTVEVRIRYNDFDEGRRSESLPEPSDWEGDFYPVIDRLLRRAWERRVSLRLAGVKFSNLYGARYQDTLGLAVETARVAEEPADGCWKAGTASGRRAVSRSVVRELAAAVDRVREDFGAGAILRGHDLYLKSGERKAETGKGNLPRRGRGSSQLSGFRFPVSGFPSASFLNVRSGYSFLDSLLTPESAVRLAVEKGGGAVALTDPNLHGAVELVMAAREAGVRAVVGASVTLGGRDWLAYPRDKDGYANLCAWLTGSDGGRGDEDGAWGEETIPGVVLVPEGIFPEVHYAEPGERPMYDILQGIRTLTLLETRGRGKRRGNFSLRPPADFRAAAEAAERVLEECRYEFDLGGLNFPRYQPSDGSSAHDFLGRLAREGLRRRYGERARRHEAQLSEELGMIAQVGYEEYFLLVWDILQDCRAEGIDWITRGSAADSLVCYCLGISDVCPIRYELYFKRFLNPDRMALNKLPDIDIDFAHDRRDRVVERIFEKFGAHAAVVGGFSTYQGRSAFADIAKVFGVSEEQIRRYTEHLPRVSAAGIVEAVHRSRECADLDFGENPYATALALARRLDGFPRHPKMHPCGVVLSREPVARLCPLFHSAKGLPTTHFDMDSVEAIGLVKIDILAQGGLAVMRDAVEEVERQKGEDRRMKVQRGTSSFHLLPSTFDDPSVWEMIASGGGRGVHHIESPAMTSLNRMVKVGNIDDLIAIVSVIRPGAANTMRKVTFARRAQGLEPVEYAHPSLEPVLRSTYGVVAYEEHILQICEAFASMPAGRADMLRRALVKGRAEKAEAFFGEFEGFARGVGRSGEEIERVWKLVMGFQGYAFCRAHSTAYGIEAYQAAWLKKYYPAEFLAAVLTHGKGFYDRLTYSIECRRLGIGFLSPDVNRAGERYIVDRKAETGALNAESGVRSAESERMPQPGCGGGSFRSPHSAFRSIQVPLWQVKGLSEGFLERWRAGKPFESFRDFVFRCRPNTAELDALIRAGACDGFGQTREELFWEARRLTVGGGPEPLFQWAGVGVGDGFEVPSGGCGRLERLRDEMELLGFPVSGHPLEMFPDVAWETYCPIGGLDAQGGGRVVVAGLAVAHRVHHQADGRPMKFLSLCDPTGIVECELFARTYARYGTETIRHPVIEVTADVQPFENGNGFTLNVVGVRKARRRKAR